MAMIYCFVTISIKLYPNNEPIKSPKKSYLAICNIGLGIYPKYPYFFLKMVLVPLNNNSSSLKVCQCLQVTELRLYVDRLVNEVGIKPS